MTLKMFLHWLANPNAIAASDIKAMDPNISDYDFDAICLGPGRGHYNMLEQSYINHNIMPEIQKYANLLDSHIELIDEGTFDGSKATPMHFKVIGSHAEIKIGISIKNQYEYFMSYIARKDFSSLGEWADVPIYLQNLDYDNIAAMLYKELWGDNPVTNVWHGSTLNLYKWPINVSFDCGKTELNDADYHLLANLRKDEIKYPVKVDFINTDEINLEDLNL